jgi:hypothetical protein
MGRISLNFAEDFGYNDVIRSLLGRAYFRKQMMAREIKLTVRLALLTGVLALARPAAAQSSLTPAEFNALVQELETTTPQPASSAPLFGQFYTITHGESWPPLPADTMGLPFWTLQGGAQGVYVLDDRGF